MLGSLSSEARKAAASGAHLDIEFLRVGPDDRIERSGAAAAGEEVAVVLEGHLHVDAAEESYDLSVGEGIIIPPGEGSIWQSANGGLLYRVIVHPHTTRE